MGANWGILGCYSKMIQMMVQMMMMGKVLKVLNRPRSSASDDFCCFGR